jgi:hypothetical protein
MSDTDTQQDTAFVDEMLVDGAAGDEAPEGAEALGDAGKRAIDAMKAKERAARAELREWKALGLTPADVKALIEGRKADSSEEKPDLDAIRREAERAALSKANQRVIRAEVKAAAKGIVADDVIPDLPRLLDLAQFEVDDDGNLDPEDVRDALADFLNQRPSLAAQGGRRFQGSGDGGARKETQPSLDEQIRDAETAGDWKLSRRLKNAKFLSERSA